MECDSMKKETLRKVPKKNYILLGIILLGTVCLVYYFYTWSRLYNEVKLVIDIIALVDFVKLPALFE